MMQVDEVCADCGVRESAHIDELQGDHEFMPADDLECRCKHPRRFHHTGSGGLGICYQCANEVPENAETDRTKPWEHRFTHRKPA